MRDSAYIFKVCKSKQIIPTTLPNDVFDGKTWKFHIRRCLQVIMVVIVGAAAPQYH